jgi:signal transduction histidine kinase
LDHSLRSTLDATLAARATPYLQVLAEPGRVELPLPTAQEPSPSREGLAVVIDPTGAVKYAQPARARSIPVSMPAGRSTRLLDLTFDGEKLRLRVDGVSRADGTWTVLVGVDRETTEAAAEKVQDVLEYALPALLLIIVAATWTLAGAALTPVERMRAEAGALGHADAAGRLTVPEGRDELHALAVTFNDLLERLHLSLAQQRDLVADAGHELRTPLAILCAELELADRPGRSAQELREAISGARAEAARLAALAEDLLLLATHEGRPATPVDLSGVAAEAVEARRGPADRAGVRLDLTAPETCVTLGDPTALRRALDNLLGNALDHSPPGSTVEMDIDARPDAVVLRVRDGGPGFPPDFLPHAFDRFRRADTARSSQTSHGLGLAIVAAIATNHGGTAAAVNNEPPPGACVSITLPRTT